MQAHHRHGMALPLLFGFLLFSRASRARARSLSLALSLSLSLSRSLSLALSLSRCPHPYRSLCRCGAKARCNVMVVLLLLLWQGPIIVDYFKKFELERTVLKKVWGLADRNQDGSLNLAEFCVVRVSAMVFRTFFLTCLAGPPAHVQLLLVMPSLPVGQAAQLLYCVKKKNFSIPDTLPRGLVESCEAQSPVRCLGHLHI